jgi:hypothetical protein
MFVRKIISLAALAVSAGAVSAQQMTTAFEARLPVRLPPVAASIPGPAGPQAVSGFADPTLRVGQLIRPITEQSPRSLQPAPVAGNPAAPPGFNRPLPIYPTESDGVGMPGRFWASGEWLFWATSGQPLPVLVTASPVGTDRTLAGVLGTPNTASLFGGERANKDFRSGYRLNAGWWLNDDRTRGIEADFFFLGNSVNNFAIASNGSQIIAQPFFNAISGRPDSQLISFPGAFAGSVAVHAENRLIGGGFNGIWNLAGKSTGRIDALLGFRYLNVSDTVDNSDNVTGPVPFSQNIQISDHFATSNNFYGGLVGLSAEKQCGACFFSLRSTVAFGVNQQSVDINGSTQIVFPPNGTIPGLPPLVLGAPRGFLAQQSNIGHYNRSVFAVVPEIGGRVGAQITEHARIFAGYNFIYLSNVVRAGDQIGGTIPAGFTPKTTDFWAQGISLGLDLRY